MNEPLDQKIRHRNAVARAHVQVSRGQTSMLMVKEAPAYSGRASEIFPIALTNLILTFLTVGIYRFWAKTRIRRYFISRVSFLGDPLEYSGTGMELFIGFLIVLAVLVPLFIVTGILRYFLERPGAETTTVAIFQAGYFLALYFLYHVAVYRAQRYRLSRTSWRGIRGGQVGSAMLYAICAIGLGVLTVATVGLAYPVMRRFLVRYRINHLAFGTETLQLECGVGRLLAGWMVPWLFFAAILGYVGYSLAQKDWSVIKNAAPDMVGAVFISMFTTKVVIAMAILPFGFLLLIWYRVFEIRQWINHSRFGELAFASRLRALQVMFPYLAYWFLATVASGLVIAGSILLMRKLGGADFLFRFGAFSGLYFVAVFWVIAGILRPMILTDWLIDVFCRTLTIQGRFSPDTLFQNQLAIPRSGEGLADAFDVDAF